MTLATGAALTAEPLDPLRGAWHNDDSTVAIHIDQCGTGLCGKVISASAQAVADARSGGTEHLIGTTLFKGYHRDGPNYWSGTVFVPDLGHSFSSHIVMIDHDHARIAGCLLGRFLCQSEIWQRQ
ncbi:DUF2147 domain-containing protein [Novosphingobium sp.]|uniref:DUF2147 domain-containing protein n=1 Tax=Novosphingobium sp. TaxID=1874826 RepID=UPI0038BB853C